MYPDILDDLFTPALELAQEFKDLTVEVDNFMGTSWTNTLIGPDPGAAGRQNRSQRAAGLGNQAGTHLSKQGMPMLIPDNSPKGSMLTPKAHVAKAQLLDHPFQTPPNLPLDLQYASLASIHSKRSRSKRMEQAQRLNS